MPNPASARPALDIEHGDDRSSADAGHPESIQFCSIEKMQSACEEDGWSVEYRQLQPGRLKASTVSGACGDITLLDEAASVRIELTGQTPVGQVTVLAPCTGSRIWLNGHWLGDSQILLLDSKTDNHIVTGEDNRILSMHIPISLMQRAGCDVGIPSSSGMRGGLGLIELGAVGAWRLRRLMHDAIYQFDPGHQRARRIRSLRARDLVNFVGGATRRSVGGSRNTGLTPAADSWRTVERARRFVESNLGDRIRMNDVCTYAAVSLSKLERSFRAELQMTPSEYVLARRLTAARHQFTQCAPGRKDVAQVACDVGFNHLSRFAGAYRDYFGELPSATLRSADV